MKGCGERIWPLIGRMRPHCVTIPSCLYWRCAGEQQLWFLVLTQLPLCLQAMRLMCERINQSVARIRLDPRARGANHAVTGRVDVACLHIWISSLLLLAVWLSFLKTHFSLVGGSYKLVKCPQNTVEWGNKRKGKRSSISISWIMFLHSHVLLRGLKKKKNESSSLLKSVQVNAFGCFLPFLASDLHGQLYWEKRALQTAWKTFWEGAHKSQTTDRDTLQSTCLTSVSRRTARHKESAVDPFTESMYCRSWRFSVTQTQVGLRKKKRGG